MRKIYDTTTYPVVLLLISVSLGVYAQPRMATIPELVAGGSTGRTYGLPSGKAPTVDELLVDAEIVVKATVGEALGSYLSHDERHVYTDYRLSEPLILYQSGAARASPKPGKPELVVAQLGGTVRIGEAAFTYTPLGLPRLQTGMTAIFILKEQDGKKHLAQRYFGAFVVTGDTVEPLVAKHDFAPEYRGTPVSRVLTDLAARLAARAEAR